MSKILSSRHLLAFWLIGLVAWTTLPASAQTIGSPIGSIAFKQDLTGSVNGFLIENLSDVLPDGTPANVQFSQLSLTVGTHTVLFDNVLGSPLVLAPGTSVDTTDTQFPLDNLLQYDATNAPTSAVLSGKLLDSSGKALNFTLSATMPSSYLQIPSEPGGVNSPITIVISQVPGPDSLLISAAGFGLGLIQMKRRQRRQASVC